MCYSGFVLIAFPGDAWAASKRSADGPFVMHADDRKIAAVRQAANTTQIIGVFQLRFPVDLKVALEQHDAGERHCVAL